MYSYDKAIVIINANIISFSESITGNAILIKNGKIIKISSSREILNGVKGKYILIDAHGRSVLPAFIDAHTHLIDMAKRVDWIDLSKVNSLEGLKKVLQTIAEKTRKGDWILGYGWDESKWLDERRYPTKKDLDEVSRDHPIFLRRIDGHMAVANTKALEELKIPKGTPGFSVDTKGNPTGVLKEDAFLLAEKRLRISVKSFRKGLRRIVRLAIEKGVVMCHETLSLDDFLLINLLASEWKHFPIEIYTFILESFMNKLIDLGITREIGAIIRVGGIKIFVDGSIGARTAALYEPYSDDPSTKGMLLMSEDDLLEICRKADKASLQLAIHAIGDRAIDVVLSALKKAQINKENRHRIEHFELVHDECIPEVKNLGIVLSMQPNFIGQWQMPGGMYEKRLGKIRWKSLNPLGKLMKEGLIIAFGSDCMPFDPFFGLWSAVNHPIEENKLSIFDAVKAYTLHSAYAAHIEHITGDIKESNLANIIILNKELRKIKSDDILNLRILCMIARGELIYLKVG